VTSAEKWESVTWDWVEREIVEYLLTASKEPDKAQSLFNRLVKASEPASPSQRSAAALRRSASNA
jgi:hypothetical protein